MKLAQYKRSLRPGDEVRITNHYRPQANRVAEVMGVGSTHLLVSQPWSTGRPSRIAWPRASHFRYEGDGRASFLADPRTCDPPNRHHPEDQPWITVELVNWKEHRS